MANVLELLLLWLLGVEEKSVKGWKLGVLGILVVASCGLLYYLLLYRPGL